MTQKLTERFEAIEQRLADLERRVAGAGRSLSPPIPAQPIRVRRRAKPVAITPLARNPVSNLKLRFKIALRCNSDLTRAGPRAPAG